MSLEIALVNNMPDSALEATERQFRGLLQAAGNGLPVSVTFYAIREVPRGTSGLHHVSAYRDIDELWDRRLDGIIVTGTEPKAANLREEPYWQSLSRLLDWAERNTYSAVWSCLAAHAAILHMDDITRRPLAEKRFGVFDCERRSDHPLMCGTSMRLRMPHSRWNDIPEDALTSSGYGILMRSTAGVDAFVKQLESLFVFFQGHPEYEAQTLLLEYRRDIKRFLKGERDTYPEMPRDYFEKREVDVLSEFQIRALKDRREDLIEEFPTSHLVEILTNTWLPAATSVYRNWLKYIEARKSRAPD
jgi:homoserine O-succinyltransferase